MFRFFHCPPSRRGVVLLVVIVLLTLFAAVGIAFVMYANSEANSSRIFRESYGILDTTVDTSAQQLFNFAMAQLIYGVPDDATGVYSALRGHDMARNMYGWNYGTNSTGPDALTAGSNIIPFNGPGRLHYPNTSLGASYPANDDYQYINYTYFSHDGFLRDPEHYGTRSSLSTTTLGAYSGWNAPYTYPDLNSMFLGAMKSDGTVITPSFYRQWLFGSLGKAVTSLTSSGAVATVTVADTTGFSNGDTVTIAGATPAAYNGSFTISGVTGTTFTYNFSGGTSPASGIITATNNPNWGNTTGKYLIQRPRPQEMDSTFPYPTGLGDVQNLVGGPSGNDSIWIDVGYPVSTTPNGIKYKPLFAFFVTDLDKCINLNVAGNINANDPANPRNQGSNQGWGGWEVNPRQLVTSATNTGAKQTQLANLLLGSPTTGPVINYLGRYGKDRAPGTAGNSAAAGTPRRVWGPVDFDGYNEKASPALTHQFALPLVGQSTIWPFPSLWTSAPFTSAPYPYTTSFTPYASVQGYGNASPGELLQHPLQYDFFNPAGSDPNNQADDQVFDISNMKKLLYDGITGTEFQGSDLTLLCNTSPLDTTKNPFYDVAFRHLVTTHSFDVDRPGIMPWIWDPINASSGGVAYQLAAGAFYPSGGPMYFPTTPGSAPSPPTAIGKQPGDVSGLAANSEFAPDWRASLKDVQFVNQLSTPTAAAPVAPYPGLGRVDLNRTLPDYPAPDSNGNLDYTNAQVKAQFNAAQTARQNMAADILRRLQVATGTPPTTATPPGDTNANRWLAQLAVNMVDYIDSDDIMTPFYWQNPDGTAGSGSGTDVVFGTELPRVVINEAYCEYQNDPQDNAAMKATHPYWYNFWIELLNPLPNPADAASRDDGSATLQTTGTGAHAIYKLDVTSRNSLLRAVTDPTANPGGNRGDLDVFTITALTCPGAAQTATATGNGTTVTVTVASTANFAVGDSVAIRGMTPSGYNGNFIISGTLTGTTFQYANTTMGAGSGTAQDVTATATVASSAFLNGGDHITIAGADQAEYNGTYTMTAVPDGTHFKYAFGGSTTGSATGTKITYTTLLTEISDFTSASAPTTIAAANGAYYAPTNKRDNRGFYMVGPPDAAGPTMPPVQVPFPSDPGVDNTKLPQVTLQVVPNVTSAPFSTMSLPESVGAGTVPAQTNLQSFTFVLRRLACPALPPNPINPDGTLQDSTKPCNPYITVDYIENVPTYDGVRYDNTGARPAAGMAGGPTDWSKRTSWGRKQPYGAWSAWSLITKPGGPDTTRLQLLPQQVSTALVSQPQHTFFAHNYETYNGPGSATPTSASVLLKSPFDWLVHLDRQLASAIELLQSPAFRPHELTQQLVAPPYFTTSQTAVTITTPGTPVTMDVPVASLTGYTNIGPWNITNGQVIVDTGPNQELVTVNSVNATATPPTFNATFNRSHPSGFPVFGDTPKTFAQTAPWYDPNSRLSRVLEFLETGSRAAGIGVGGRVPGKVNVNTYQHPETLLALCDTQDAADSASSPNPNYFVTNDVNTLSNSLINTLRSPVGANGVLVGPTNIAPPSGWATNRPFLSLVAPFTPVPATPPSQDQQFPQNSVGMDDTLLRAGPSSTSQFGRLFDVTGGQAGSGSTSIPSLQTQLLSKIYNNLTTRSNVFAVWATVGYFQVAEPAVTSLTSSGTTATGTVASTTGWSVGDTVRVAGAVPAAYNGDFPITGLTATTFTYTFSGGTSPATGTITARDLQQPIKLGAEIGYPNTNIRHRMFCIVDRTNLTIAPGQSLTQIADKIPNAPNGTITGASKARPIVITSNGHNLLTGSGVSISGVGGNTAANGSFTITVIDGNNFSLNGSDGTTDYTTGGNWVASPPFVNTVGVGALSNQTSPTPVAGNWPTSIKWQIQVGSTLVVDTGLNQETVVVNAVDNSNPASPKITANFLRRHTPNASVNIPGNPGPQPFFDALDPKYIPVVPYFQILQ
jgi:hypothetical protein